MKEITEVATVGEASIESMTESEQKTFLIAMLTRILELRRQQLSDGGV